MNQKEIDAYVEKALAKLDEWKAEIDKIEAKAKQTSADTKIKYQEQIKSLREKRANMKHKLDVIKEVGEEEWEELKKDADEIAGYLKKELKDLRTRM